ncbi:uncharacterized protein [Nicotiana tomentosiformis]|uniref:uncharacterized protein n=1 Tax=Nicotiana tomentosiformis TaxID=4098 RepID=UPI00388CD013
MTWMLDAEIHLDAMGLGDAIKDKNKASTQECAKALIFLRHHLDEGLKIEYLTVKDPLILWNGLKERYDNLKLVTLSQVRYDWAHLRLQDFKSVSKYNSVMFRITSKLKLSGDSITDYDMLEKTFTTFHASNMVLQQQYREKGRVPVRGRGRGQGRNLPSINHSPRKNNFQKWTEKGEKSKAKDSETECYRCGGKGHLANICRILKYLVELYQASLNNKGPEANFLYDNKFDITHLDVADFFEHPDGKINHLIGDESVVNDD